MDIKSLINKVIASKGILRIPSWWMKKLLTEIVGYIDSRDSANAKSIDRAKKEADSKIKNLESEIKFDLLNLKKSLHTQKCFVVKTGASAGYVVVDGVTQDIPANTQKIITFTGTFRFSIDSGSRYQSIEFIGLTVTDVSTMTSMERMFDGCEKLTSLDLSGLDTSAVTNMYAMFFYCMGIKSINLSGINTSSVTNMSSMFYECRALTSLDLSSFDTSSVTNMGGVFTGCKALTSLLLGPNVFKTSAVTSIDFSDCSKWTNDTVVTSLVTNSYDRASAGLNTLTLQLHANTKAVLSDEQKAAITSKGYTIA